MACRLISYKILAYVVEFANANEWKYRTRTREIQIKVNSWNKQFEFGLVLNARIFNEKKNKTTSAANAADDDAVQQNKACRAKDEANKAQ